MASIILSSWEETLKERITNAGMNRKSIVNSVNIFSDSVAMNNIFIE